MSHQFPSLLLSTNRTLPTIALLACLFSSVACGSVAEEPNSDSPAVPGGGNPGGKADGANSACELPPEPGPCNESLERWYLDADTWNCELFIYGGCGGNANNFETKEACKAACPIPELTTCELPADPGPCEGHQERWFHDDNTGNCELFTYGGCEGNANNFETETACEAACYPKPAQNACKLPPEPGPCEGHQERWYLDAYTWNCELFIYGGCEGNANNFETKEACQAACPIPELTTCELPADPGPCEGHQERWFHDDNTGNCELFTYGGCEGNANNFESEAACEAACYQ